MSTRLLSYASLLALAIGCGGPPDAQLPVAPAPLPPSVASTVPAAPKNGTPAAPIVSALGDVSFPVTGSSECQRLFREGILALHSFLYDQAQLSFAAALTADPSCS